MPLVPLRPVLDATVKYGYAQGAFNVNAVAQAEAVIAVHEMFRSPAILQGADLANAGGYTSVMIDGSSLPFEENVELTREVVKYAHARGVSVEGELGVLAGVEDHVFAANSTARFTP